MNLDAFFTSQITSQSAPTKGAAASTTSHAAFTGAQSFIDFLINQTSEAKTAAATAATTAANTKTDDAKSNLVAAFFSDSAEIQAQVQKDSKNFSLDILTQIADALNLNQAAIKAQLDQHPELVKNLPLEQQPKSIQELLRTLVAQDKNAGGSLQQIMDQLKKLAADGSPLVITANLTPDQLTTLKCFVAPTDVFVPEGVPLQGAEVSAAEQTADKKDKNIDDALASLMFGLVSLLPPDQRPQVIVLPRNGLLTSTPVNIDANSTSKPANDISSTLNNLVSPASGSGLPETAEDGKGDFKNLIAQMGGSKIKGVDGDKIGNEGSKNPSVTPDLSTLQSWQFDPSAALSALSAPSDDILGLQSTAAFHVNSPAGLTNLVTQAQNVSQTLVPSQMVAMTLQKQAADGENKTFRLQLDPPELGRVEVRLEFAKDKSVKAHMIVENSDTYNMLQRDSHNLERTLQASGVETGDASLSFELASHDHDFQQNGGHENGRNNYNLGDVASSETVTETTMTWHVDPDTGYTRYRLLA